MIESFIKLIEASTSLLKERRLRKMDFMKEVLTPIHENFEAFCSSHRSTFQIIRDGLDGERVDFKRLHKEVQRRLVSERSQWKLFEAIEGLTSVGKIDLSPYFESYLNDMKSCLQKLPSARDPEEVSIAFYDHIEHHLWFYAQKHIRTNKDKIPQGVAECSEMVERTVKAFEGYSLRVQKRFLELKAHCLA